MNFNNSYRIYLLALMEKHNPGRRLVTITEGMKEATYALLQRGSKMRTQAPGHPSPVRDMTIIYDTRCGKRKRLDTKGVTTRLRRARTVPVEDISSKLYKLRNKQ